MGCGASHDRRPIARPAEDHDVAGHRHDRETAAELHRRQIGVHPLDGGLRSTGKAQQIVVEVDTDDVNSATGQLHRNPTHSATGVENAGGMQRLDEVGLAVR